MDETLEFGECYICLEDTPLLSQCLCKKRFLCENCMEKLRIYKYKQCTVCHATYPKLVEEEHIDIQFVVEEEVEEDFRCVPCCLRPKRERHKPKYCLLDFMTHVCCIYFMMLTGSCVSLPHPQCYSWNIMGFFFPALITYVVICLLLSMVRR